MRFGVENNASGLGFLAFATGNNTASERLRIDSSGKVGINTSSPAATLSVDALAGNSTVCLLKSPTANAYLQLGNSANDQGYLGYQSSDMTFYTASTEKMRLDENGLISNYASGNSTNIRVRNAASAGSTVKLFQGMYSGSTPTTGGTTSFIVYTNGNVENTNDSYGQISDIKLKENIVDSGSQWDDFKAVRFRKYNFKEETGHETHTQLGVIAQELELTSPGLVYETADKDEDGNDLGTTTKAVKSSILTKKALVALQEAMTRIEQLEAKVAALEAG